MNHREDMDPQSFGEMVLNSGIKMVNFTVKMAQPSFIQMALNLGINNTWYKNGKRHRKDGPAVIWGDGSQFWYKNGKRHREDGHRSHL